MKWLHFFQPSISKLMLTVSLWFWIPTATMCSWRYLAPSFHSRFTIVGQGFFYFFFFFPIALFNLITRGRFTFALEKDQIFPSPDSVLFALVFMGLIGYLISCAVFESLPSYRSTPLSIFLLFLVVISSVFLTTRWWMKIFNQK